MPKFRNVLALAAWSLLPRVTATAAPPPPLPPPTSPIPVAARAASGPESANPRQVSLRWAMAARRGTSEVLDVERHVELSAGDGLRFFLDAEDGTVVYLFRLKGERLEVLLPREPGPSSTVPEREVLYLPDEAHWWTLDKPPGLTKFYLVATTRPLADLDDQIRTWRTAGEDARRPETGKLLTLIRRYGEDWDCAAGSSEGEQRYRFMGAGFDVAAFARPLEGSHVAVRLLCVDQK